jgi:predicted ATP-dependent endonuclease of OLD family
MELSFYINQINFKDGTQLSLNKNAIVVFVGPNNSGKSRTLKELQGATNGQSTGNYIINDIEITASGTEEQLQEKLKSRLRGSSYMYLDRGVNSGMDRNSLMNYWKTQVEKPQKNASAFSSFFVKFLDTTARLGMISPAGNIDTYTDLKTHPIQELKADSAKELIFSEYFKKAFGDEVIVNHAAGANIPLHVGKRPEATLENDRVSSTYQHLLRQQPFLHEQGDGMKSFAGIFLSLFADDYKINLVDEPEAFLHPPQATLLGQMTATKLAQDKQVFIATHSEHLLKGLLDSAADRVIIIRLERKGSIAKTKVLENQDIKKIWEDSLLRHSNILDGLFHKAVVLVESDSDCLFIMQ